MKQKRAKAYRKQMQAYQHTFKFMLPIQCLADSELVLHCEKTAFELTKGIARTIQSDPKMMITQCCIQHLYDSRNQPAIEIAKTMEKRRCNHRETLSSYECIKSIVDVKGENKHRYLVATQDEKLRKALRRVPGVPLIYMNRSVMIMEPLSPASMKVQQRIENGKLTGGLNSKHAGVIETEKPKAIASGDKVEANAEGTETEKPKKRKRGPKEPNPLSMKKKKTEKTSEDANDTNNQNEGNGDDLGDKKRRKRKHKKSTQDTDETEETHANQEPADGDDSE
ncbi:unnamed protein product [Kuraishia capsulata CBS 1993]|uniref:U three protein 23 n=1 Tax=Kuraishia capsulata CBS 1993 TaxID=1382522 RepID=W6MK72_9ASCO|nr:uncharacterized protein KUCA_T00002365001 [Kuraishia capsulata CBS 1993]CDK26393.1 unnamed protein product [Kuraishia capsulata CBS 1993]